MVFVFALCFVYRLRVCVCFVFVVGPLCLVFAFAMFVCSISCVCCVLCLMCLLAVFAVFVFTTVFVFARSEAMSFPLCSTTAFVISFAHFCFSNQLVFVFARRLATKVYMYFMAAHRVCKLVLN